MFVFFFWIEMYFRKPFTLTGGTQEQRIHLHSKQVVAYRGPVAVHVLLPAPTPRQAEQEHHASQDSRRDVGIAALTAYALHHSGTACK